MSNYNELHRRNSVNSVTPLETVVFISFIGLLFGLVILLDNRLPAPLSLKDEQKYQDAFIAERAKNNLDVLTENGSRIVGSFENEIGAVNFLLREIENISNSSVANKRIEVDVQTVNGSYYVDYRPFGAYNIYGNVQNIIVKIHAQNFSEYSILVNAHFDSVPTSPGGSDDGIMCVVMLEIIRKLSQLTDGFTHNIIFLFNGAEETPLQASHGFITQHKWAKEIKIVVNLEAAGSGGKEILFQSGPGHSWLLDYYTKVPHPYGQVAGEEIFQSNVIPSDTDFRIFRDYGHTIGFDFAFFKNGYRYHTSFDNTASIPLGSYQHVGDNMLALIKNLANAPEIYNTNTSYSKAVYFDVFGMFMVSYKEYVGMIINLLVILSSYVVTFKSFKDFQIGVTKRNVIYISLTVSSIFLGWVISAAGVYVIGMIIDGLNYSMSWYGSPWLIFGLYGVPTLMFSWIPLILWNYMNRELHFGIRVQSQVQSSIIILIWTTVLLVLTCVRIRAAYALMIPVLFNTVACFVIHIKNLHQSAKGWKIVHIVFNIFPTMMLFYQSILVLSLFIPVTGRIGSEKNPDIIIGAITMVLTILISSFYMHFVTMMKKPFWLMYFFLVIFLITFAIVVSPLGFPYSGNPESPAPQRFMIYHTKRIFNGQDGLIKRDSGYFVVNLDRNSPRSVFPYVRQFEKRVSIKEDCYKFLVCGLPLFSPRMLQVMEKSTWIPAEEPIINEEISLTVNSQSFLNATVLRLDLTATGPDHFNVYLSPKNNVSLVNISFDTIIPSSAPTWNGRPLYFVNFAWGVSKTPLDFYVDLEVPRNWSNAIVDIGISGKYVHVKKNVYTPQFGQFLREFPSWTNIVPAIANFESWEI